MAARPRLLDLFARAQGAAVGYARAGFVVYAVDILRYPRHPEISWWSTADAFDVLADVKFCRTFDVITGSPPCQRYSTMTSAASRAKHPDLIGPFREACERIGRPYVIENVAGARRELRDPLKLCGSSFDLAVRRHRLFEIGAPRDHWPDIDCRHVRGSTPVGVYGSHPEVGGVKYLRPNGVARGDRAATGAEARPGLWTLTGWPGTT